ncbi:MAG TPA: DoxX family membrane protein [Acidimicrobiales bacterium]|nr:DoxX family membrane protein [Acidimicrobiales bacterium]
MNPIRYMARPLMGGLFVMSGVDVLRNPEPRAKAAAPLLDEISDRVGKLPADSVQLVQANAAVHVVAGTMLTIGRAPRLAAAALAASLVPTTLGGHRFWEFEDPQQASQQRVHFMKNAAILGGLLFAATDRRRSRRKSWPGATLVARALRRG